MHRSPVLLVALVLLVLAGCGGSEKPAVTSGAAAFAPPGTPVYVEVDLHPGAEQSRALDGIVARLPGSGDARARLEAYAESALPGEVSFARDIRPWLGDSVGFYALKASGEGDLEKLAFVVLVRDRAAAERALARVRFVRLGRDGDATRFSNGSTVVTVLDGALIAGDSEAVRAGVAAARGDSLAESDAFRDAPRASDKAGFATLFTDLGSFTRNLSGLGGAGDRLKQLLGDERSLSVVRAEDGALVADFLAPRRLGALGTGLFGTGGPLAAEAPADAWAVTAQRDLLADLDPLLGLAGDRADLERQLRSETGLELTRLRKAFGAGSLWLRGAPTSAGLEGALVLEVRDRGEARAALLDVERALRARGLRVRRQADTPSLTGITVSGLGGRPVLAVLKGDRLAVAYGSRALLAALFRGPRLENSPTHAAEERALGAGYDLATRIDVPELLSLLSPGATARLGPAGPYLEALGPFLVGVRADGDDYRIRYRITLR